jgi:hypothetical protein
MSRRAAVISIDVEAGNAKMILDLEKAKGKIREFGAAGVSEHKAMAAAMKDVEGGFLSNKRAADAFLEMIPGLGNAVRAAFPVIGALALGGVLVEVGTKVREFFKEFKEGPEKAATAFREQSTSMQSTNDQLALDIIKLNNETAKLEGKHENGLAVMLAEARVEADKLGESVVKDIESIQKLLKEQETNYFARLFTGEHSSTETDEGFKKLHKQMQQINIEQSDSSSYGPQRDFNKERLALLLAAKASETKALQPMQTQSVYGQTVTTQRPEVELDKTKDRIAELDKAIAHLNLEVEKGAAVATNAGARAAHSNESLTKPFADKMAELKAQLEGLRAVNTGIGGTEAQRVAAEAIAATDKQIAALTNLKLKIGDVDKAKLLSVNTSIAQAEHDKESATKLQETIHSLQERISAERNLAAAIGATYAVARDAAIQTEVAKATKDHTNDPAWLAAHQREINAAAAAGGQLFDLSQGAENSKKLLAMNQQIDLETQLAAAQREGAEAVRQATLAHKIKEIALTNEAGAAKQLIQAEMELYNAQRANVAAANVDKIEQETQATEHLTEATRHGALALREARVENEVSKARRDSGVVPGAVGVSNADLNGEVQATKDKAAADLKADVVRAAASADRLKAISDEINLLKLARGTEDDTFAVEIKLRDLENERLKVMVQQTLQIKTAGAGVKAFFLQMQEDSKSTADIIYQTLNSALDKTSDNLAKMATDQKPKGGWGKMWGDEFKQVGQQGLSTSIKGMIEWGLTGSHGKPDGSKGKPFYVKNADQQSSSSSSNDPNDPNASSGIPQQGGLIGILQKLLMKKLSGLGSAGDSGGGDSGGGGDMIGGGDEALGAGGGMAEGGDVDPGRSYMVSDSKEDEYFIPKSSGSIVPNHKMGGGDVYNFTNTIDARGAALGVENRIARSVEASHRQAVINAVKANVERSKRTPKRSGG